MSLFKWQCILCSPTQCSTLFLGDDLYQISSSCFSVLMSLFKWQCILCSPIQCSTLFLGDDLYQISSSCFSVLMSLFKWQCILCSPIQCSTLFLGDDLYQISSSCFSVLHILKYDVKRYMQPLCDYRICRLSTWTPPGEGGYCSKTHSLN